MLPNYVRLAVVAAGSCAALVLAPQIPSADDTATPSAAEAQIAAGRYQTARTTLEQVVMRARASADERALAESLASLASAETALGDQVAAREHLEESIALARKLDDARLEAMALTNLGTLQALRGELEAAVVSFERSAERADEAGDRVAAARGRANGARAAQQAGRADHARALAGRAEAAVESGESPAASAQILVHVSWTRMELGPEAGREQPHYETLHRNLTRALALARGARDDRTASFALGYLAEVYAGAQYPAEALKLVDRAIFRGERAGAAEALYQWYQLRGRLLAAKGATAEADGAYARAVELLQTVRHEMHVGYGAPDVQRTLSEIYREYVSFILTPKRFTSASGTAIDDQVQLARARDLMEQLKAQELRDYFRDDCVDVQRKKVRQLDDVATNALIVYPIALSDRLELLITRPDATLTLVSVPVAEGRLTAEVRRFRALLEKRTTNEYLRPARQLYDWLVRPLEPLIAETDPGTLVWVSGGSLRTIPFAALHDGERFLVEKWASAVVPGIDLTDPRPLERRDLTLLAGGVSDAVQGYPALSYVAREVSTVASSMKGEVLLNRDFVESNVEAALTEGRYSIVHIATHGEFHSSAERNFLLTYDGRLTMDRIETYLRSGRFRERPVELLMLSACDTAAGDDLAALGLSGVAVKAGVRSAIGSLWPVNDQATAMLVEAFYDQLSQPGVSRAQALQQAQNRLRDDLRYRHPGYWSPLLLISNWQ
jgi:CHAT domain-containing protein